MASAISSPANGGLVLLNSLTVSSAVTSVDIGAGLDLDVTFDTKYDDYIIEIYDLIPVTESRLYLRASSDTGASFYDAISDYEMNAINVTGASVSQYDEGTSRVDLGGGQTMLRNNTNETNIFKIKLSRLHDSNFYSLIEANVCQFESSVPEFSIIKGVIKESVAIDAIRLYMQTGNISAGIFRVYGVKK